MKLIQVKQFNSLTVTQDVAAKICAITGLWNHYTEERYKEKGFDITDNDARYRTYFHGKLVGSQTNPATELQISKGTTTEWYSTGISIIPKCGTKHQFRVTETGSVTCYNVWKKGEWRSSSGGKDEFYEESGQALEFPYNSVDLIQLYLDLGFFEVDALEC